VGAYEHRVRARLPDGRHVPLPVYIETVNAVFDTKLAGGADMAAFLQSGPVQGAYSREQVRQANEEMLAVLGRLRRDG
jgi:UDP-galactopyranose mutase